MSHANLRRISIVIPIYNSAPMLDALVDEIEGTLRGRIEFEIVLVNDGSSDDSWAAIERQASRYPFVRGVDLMRNYGQHNALLTGILASNHPIIVTMDDDLQHPPDQIIPMVEMLDKGFDVIYGRPEKEEHELWRVVAANVSKFVLSRFMRMEFAEAASAFRAFRADLSRPYQNIRAPQVDVDVLLSWGTVKFGVLPVTHRERMSGRSNYTFIKLVAHAINNLLAFSTAPLRLASFIGFGFIFFGVLVLLFVVVRWYQEGSVPGFPFLASVITLFAGAQLFAIGIIGEYLARIHSRQSGRPMSVVRRTTEADK